MLCFEYFKLENGKWLNSKVLFENKNYILTTKITKYPTKYYMNFCTNKNIHETISSSITTPMFLKIHLFLNLLKVILRQNE